MAGDGEEIVGAHIEHDELVVGQEAYAVDAGGKCVALDGDGDFCDEVGLVFAGDFRRVAAGIDQGGKDDVAVRELDAAGVAHLDGGGLAFEPDLGGKELLSFNGGEDLIGGRG